VSTSPQFLESSRNKLTLMEEAGFASIRFRESGRYPYLWNSMILSGIRRVKT
jgi:hypothetical protein